MATNVGSMFVEVGADLGNFNRGMHRVDRTLMRMGRLAEASALRGFTKLGIAAGAATTIAVAGMKKATEHASDLEEAMNVADVAFSENAATVKQWSQSAVTNLGLTQAEALQGAASIGLILDKVDLGGKTVADMSTKLVQLGTDMGSAFNEEPAIMLERLRAGLTGESEPLKRFGVLINESRVATEALNMGLAKQGQKLTEQQKVLARYSLIMKDTEKVQGDWGRTSNGFANSQRQLTKAWDQAQAVVGTKFLPIMTKLVQVGVRALPALAKGAVVVIEAFESGFSAIGKFVSKVAAAKGWKAKLNVVWTGAKGAATSAAKKIARFFRKTKWGDLLSGAIEVTGTAFAFTADVVTTLKDKIMEAIGKVDWAATGTAIGEGFKSAITFTGEVFEDMIASFEAHRQPIAEALSGLIVSAFLTLLDPVFWAKNWELALAVGLLAFGGPIGKLAGKFGVVLLRGLSSPIRSAMARLGPFIGRGMSQAFDDAIRVLSRWGSRIGAVLSKGFARLPGMIQRFLRTGLVLSIVGGVKAAVDALGEFGRKAGEAIRNAGSAIAAKAGAIKTAVTNLARGVPGKAKAIGRAIVRGVKLGIRGIEVGIAAAFRAAWDALQALAGVAVGQAKVVGDKIVEGVSNGVEGVWEAMQKLASWVWDGIVMTASRAWEAAQSIGSNIIDGILAGLAGLVGRVGSKIASEVGGAISWAESKIPFGSPLWHTAQERLGKPIVEGILLGIKDIPERVGTSLAEKLGKALTMAREKLQPMQDKMAGAFDRLAIDALEAFDAATDRKLTKIERRHSKALGNITTKWDDAAQELIDTGKTIENISIDSGLISGSDASLTPAEEELKRIRESDAESDLQRALEDAQKERQDILHGGGTPDFDRLAEADRRLEEARKNIKIAALEKTAEAERKARDDATEDALKDIDQRRDAEQSEADKDFEREARNLGARRRLRRRALEDMLADLRARLGKNPKVWRQAHSKIMRLFRSEFGPNFKTAGRNLGTAFAKGLTESFKEMRKAAQSLAKMIADYLKPGSGTRKGPMQTLPKWGPKMVHTIGGGMRAGALDRPLASLVSGVPSARMGGVGSVAGSGNVPVQVVVQGSIYGLPGGADELAREVTQAQQRQSRRQGALFTNVQGVQV